MAFLLVKKLTQKSVSFCVCHFIVYIYSSLNIKKHPLNVSLFTLQFSVSAVDQNLIDGFLQFLDGLHDEAEAFLEVSVPFLRPGCLRLSDPGQDVVQLLLHLPLLLQLGQQSLSGTNLCLVGSVEVCQRRLELQHFLDGAAPTEKLDLSRRND